MEVLNGQCSQRSQQVQAQEHAVGGTGWSRRFFTFSAIDSTRAPCPKPARPPGSAELKEDQTKPQQPNAKADAVGHGDLIRSSIALRSKNA